MTHAIEIERLTKSFGEKKALNEVSLVVPEGSVFALLGENGAGKSTLIRSLLGYHPIDTGSLRVLGFDPAREPIAIRRLTGYVSDAPAFYEWMTVEKTGAFAAGFYPHGFLDRFLASAKRYELSYQTKIRDLSKGMRSKVALALATASDPRLLILDEPTSGLDPLVRRQFLESMVDRAADGRTVFLSSHQIHEVERVADWIAILHRGVLQVCEPLETLKQSIVHLSFSMHDPLLPLPRLLDECQSIDVRQSGRNWQLMIRGLDPGLLESLKRTQGVFDVQTIRPNLEELYVAFTRDALPQRPTSSTENVA